MAITLQLYSTGPAGTIDLLTGTFKAIYPTWTPQYAGGLNPGLIGEGPILLLGQDSAANLRSAAQNLEDALNTARLNATNSQHRQYTVMRYASDGGSTQQAFVVDGTVRVVTVGSATNPFADNSRLSLELTLSRTPYWEPTSATAISTNRLSCFGGTLAFSSIAGTAPARLDEFEFSMPIGYLAGAVTQIWAGIRPALEGTSNFDPILELEDGIPGTDTAAQEPGDGTGSGTGYMRTTFVDTSLVQRCYVSIFLSQGAINFNHYVGEYVVLVRARTGATTEVGLQLRTGWANSIADYQFPNEEILISDSNWKLYNMGYVRIPPYQLPTTMWTDELKYFTFAFWAERVSGSGNLDIDAICLIPYTHFFAAEDTYIWAAATDDRCTVRSTPFDVRYALNSRSDAPWASNPFSYNNWALPYDNSILVIAAQESASHVLTDEINVAGSYFPRYRGFL